MRNSTYHNQSVENTSVTKAQFFQPKLSINSPGDSYEQEADAMADKVMRMKNPERTDAFFKPAISAVQRKCTACEEEHKEIHKKETSGSEVDGGNELDRYVSSLSSSGQPLPESSRQFFEPRFDQDFSNVKVHTDSVAAKSAQSINALAYTTGNNIVFNQGQYSPNSDSGQRLMAHELTHVVQQQQGKGGIQSKKIQRREAPYIKKVTVHLTPPQTADLEWEGTPPPEATGKDHFTVSSGKGYGNPGDPPDTCARNCCTDAKTQCASPWSSPSKIGSCCTYSGNDFWTGIPETKHNGWNWWTPIQPYYSTRGVALHQHTEVTGQPISHGCVRMDDENAKRIFDFSNRQKTKVSIDGTATPVDCTEDRKCNPTQPAPVAPIQRKCAACEEADTPINRKENSNSEVHRSNELDTYVSSLSSSGQPLPESSRQFFEPRFGQDFSNVKVHTDSVAAKSAQSINALAYTTGNNIVFNQGQYSPNSDSGQRLMAHELTHVVQQSGENKSGISTKQIQRFAHTSACTQNHLDTIIWPGDGAARPMNAKVIRVLSSSSTNPALTPLYQRYFMTPTPNIAAILSIYNKVQQAFVANNYTYNCVAQGCNYNGETTTIPLWGGVGSIDMCVPNLAGNPAECIARTIIHEFTHYYARTDDNAYCHSGCVPVGSCPTTLTPAKALDNAGSYGGFAYELWGISI